MLQILGWLPGYRRGKFMRSDEDEANMSGACNRTSWHGTPGAHEDIWKLRASIRSSAACAGEGCTPDSSLRQAMRAISGPKIGEDWTGEDFVCLMLATVYRIRIKRGQVAVPGWRSQETQSLTYELQVCQTIRMIKKIDI